jgi:hypothetical protein
MNGWLLKIVFYLFIETGAAHNIPKMTWNVVSISMSVADLNGASLLRQSRDVAWCAVGNGRSLEISKGYGKRRRQDSFMVLSSTLSIRPAFPPGQARLQTTLGSKPHPYS